MTRPAANASNYYALLSIPPPPSRLSKDQLRKAYRAALLLHHPDKNVPVINGPESPTVDEIAHAYKTLSTPELKREYDAAFALAGKDGVNGKDGLQTRVVQTVDLDELVEHEDGRWTRACRCGEEEGYVVEEAQLEEAAGEGEVLVACVGCSLWVKVVFEAVEEEENR